MPSIGGGTELPRVNDAMLGEGRSSSFLCTAELQRLPSNPCRLVLLSNWNSTVDSTAPAYDALSADDLYENAGLEIYYGFNGIAAHQLFASQMSPFLPISNTDQISVKVRTGTPDRYVWFSWFS